MSRAAAKAKSAPKRHMKVHSGDQVQVMAGKDRGKPRSRVARGDRRMSACTWRA